MDEPRRAGGRLFLFRHVGDGETSGFRKPGCCPVYSAAAIVCLADDIALRISFVVTIALA